VDEQLTAADRQLGVVYDIDAIVRAGAVRHPVLATRALLDRSSRDRRSVLGMAGVLHALTAAQADVPVFYLTAVPQTYAKVLSRLLQDDGYPSGELMARPHSDPVWFLRGGRAHKKGALGRALAERPQVSWVLVGDDAWHDPELYGELADQSPDRVAAIALRQVFGTRGSRDSALTGAPTSPRGAPRDEDQPRVPVVRAANGEELLPLLQDALDLRRPSSNGPQDWLLTAQQRGNPATRLRAWTEGNAVRPLIHGRSYFPVLSEALAGTGSGDRVSLAGWRTDADELLTLGRGDRGRRVLRGGPARCAGAGAAVAFSPERGAVLRNREPAAGHPDRCSRR
jgi:hypothetical protein